MAANRNNAYLTDPSLFIQAGMDPTTKLPLKMVGSSPCHLKQNFKRALRVIDEQDATNRYTWYNLPDGLNGQMLERMLYYRGQLAFFYYKEIDQFCLLPYTLDGDIDFYGRYTGIKPLPFMGSNLSKEEAISFERKRAALNLKHFTPIYKEVELEDWIKNPKKLTTESAVLLKDYTEQLAQTITPRQELNEPILEVESECLPFMRTAMIRGTGVKGMRVNNKDEYSNVAAANKSLINAALTGEVNIPIVGAIDFQELNDGNVAKADEYMMALQSIDNFRLSTYGLENGGLFQKKERKLVSEQEMNAGGGSIGLVMQDGLSIRQRFCDIVNSIWALNIAVDVSETASGSDKNMDGEISDQRDQSGAQEGAQPAGGVNDVQ